MSPLVLVLVPLAATFVLLACAGALAGRLLARLAHAGILPAARIPSTTLRALALFAPWILAAIGCLALASPDPFTICHCAQHGLHHPHLCLSHPAFALPLVGPAAIVLAAWLIAVAPRLLRLAREVIASARWAQEIRRRPARREGEIAFRLRECGAPGAFTVGAWSPIIVVDTALWEHLSPAERRAVLLHEQGHVERGDGLTLLALRLCMALFPVPLGARLLDAWRLAAEHACDLYAAAQLGNGDTVAAALVSVEKLRALTPATTPPHMLALGVGTGAGAALERRVLALLDARPGPREQGLGNDLLAAFLITLGAAALTLAWPGDSFHHAVETLIGLLIH